MKYIIFLSIIFTLFGCGKTAIDVDESFLGFWKGSDEKYEYIFRFEEDGEGRYSYNGNGDFGNSEGKVRIKNDALKIGWKSWAIEQYPTENAESKITMIVDGLEFIKVD